jgi:hypothetical protein
MIIETRTVRHNRQYRSAAIISLEFVNYEVGNTADDQPELYVQGYTSNFGDSASLTFTFIYSGGEMRVFKCFVANEALVAAFVDDRLKLNSLLWHAAEEAANGRTYIS